MAPNCAPTPPSNTSYGLKLSANTDQIISLVTGAVFTRSGYSGDFPQFNFEDAQGNPILKQTRL